MLNLATCQVDYTAAFVQADIDTDVYVDLPRGWRQLNKMGIVDPFKENHVLKLKKGLYGLGQSPRNFFLHLKKNLETCGFKQSKFDPCLFISDKVICLVYVDDCLFYSPHQADIDTIIEDIRGTGMDLHKEDDVAGFLGVLIEKNENGLISLTQTGLIDRIITTLGLDSANSKKTPAPLEPLGLDRNGPKFADEYNYASVVGMLLYLANNTRPDITYAVSQCARYSHRTTDLHSKYLKRIGRYLLHTRTKGMILTPSEGNISINCYVDADFAGLWKVTEVTDPHCVRSRTGFIIFVNECPVIWKSRLQSLTSLSTMESEYIALSDSCRELLPLQDVVNELVDYFNLPHDSLCGVSTTIHEDNESCRRLANLPLPQITKRSKHIAVRFHWFREKVGTNWTIIPIDTKDQLADLFTKGLCLETFEFLRKQILGW